MLKKITSHNAGTTMCSHETCSNPPEYCDSIDYMGFKVYVVLCRKHYREVMESELPPCPCAITFCPSLKHGADILCPDVKKCPAALSMWESFRKERQK